MKAITSGSEKQNKWAAEIVSGWIGQFDAEIEKNDLRPKSDGVTWYSDALRVVRKSFVADVEKMSAKQIIDYRKNDPAGRLLEKAKNASKDQLLAIASRGN